MIGKFRCDDLDFFSDGCFSRVLIDGAVVGNFSVNSTLQGRNDPLMSGRSIAVYDPSSLLNLDQYFLVSSVPEVVDGKWYFCMARVLLKVDSNGFLTASTLEVRVAQPPSNIDAPWLDLSSDVYNKVADAALKLWE